MNRPVCTVLGTSKPRVTQAAFDELRQQHEQVWPMVHASRYSELAPLMNDLIPDWNAQHEPLLKAPS